MKINWKGLLKAAGKALLKKAAEALLSKFKQEEKKNARG